MEFLLNGNHVIFFTPQWEYRGSATLIRCYGIVVGCLQTLGEKISTIFVIFYFYVHEMYTNFITNEIFEIHYWTRYLMAKIQSGIKF